MSLRESHREERGVPVVEVLAQDVRHAFRLLRRNPSFTCIATLSLMLGIGANTALFSLVDDLLLRSLPVRDPDRLVQVQLSHSMIGTRKVSNSFPSAVFDHVRAHNAVFSEIVGFNQLDHALVTIDGVAEPSRQVERVSANFFHDLGLASIVGRVPGPTDGPVAVISYRLWRTRFGASPDMLGRTLTIDGEAYPIIGVAPAGFRGLDLESSADIWLCSRADTSQYMIARLKPGITLRQAQAALQVLFQALNKEQIVMPKAPRGAAISTELLSAGRGLSQIREQYWRPLLVLVILATLVLMTTCINLGSLLIVRNTARRRELTIRVALGARRSRLIVQYLVESALLAVIGGALALWFARWGVSIILSMLPLSAVPEALTFHLDTRVFGFVAAVSLLSTLLFGLAPAWRASQVDLTDALRSGERSTPSKGTRRLGRALVGCQVGLSVVLLVGAGLFVQTLRNLVSFDIGFNAKSLLQVSLDTQSSGYNQGKVGGLYRLLLERVSAVPGVRSVTAIRNPVLQAQFSRGKFNIPGRTLEPNEAWDLAEVGPLFFETMGIPFLRGRDFSATDFAQGRPVLIVSESFAKTYFPNEDPVGKRVGNLTPEIIGVVKDSKLTAIRRDSGPIAYWLAPKEPDRISALEVRTTGNANAIASAIRQEIQRIHPRLLIDVRKMQQEIDRSVSKERMIAAVSAFFSFLGLLLASIGIFGVASYTVAQRTNEIGIRIALGAGSWSVIAESLREALQAFSAGLAGGVIAAIVAVRLAASFISNLLFGLTTTNLTSLIGAILIMVAVAFAACILPARRATKIDPLTAIRYE